MKKLIIITCMALILSIASLVIALNINNINLKSLANIDIKDYNMSYNDNVSCNMIDLISSSYCLRGYLDGFFIYNLSNKNEYLGLSDLKEYGGVCWHSAKYYYDNLVSYGYNATMLIIEGNNVSHEFTIAWDPEINQKCVLDQRSVVCW